MLWRLDEIPIPRTRRRVRRNSHARGQTLTFRRRLRSWAELRSSPTSARSTPRTSRAWTSRKVPLLHSIPAPSGFADPVPARSAESRAVDEWSCRPSGPNTAGASSSNTEAGLGPRRHEPPLSTAPVPTVGMLSRDADSERRATRCDLAPDTTRPATPGGFRRMSGFSITPGARCPSPSPYSRGRPRGSSVTTSARPHSGVQVSGIFLAPTRERSQPRTP